MAGRPKGGPKTGGRKKGSTNKVSRERVAQAATMGLLPHEFLLAVSRGEKIPTAQDLSVFYYPSFAERIDAAKAAAPFYAPKLNSIAVSGALTVTHEQALEALK